MLLPLLDLENAICLKTPVFLFAKISEPPFPAARYDSLQNLTGRNVPGRDLTEKHSPQVSLDKNYLYEFRLFAISTS